MRSGKTSASKNGFGKECGGVAVEFAIILPVFLILVFGIIDFGHALYMKQVMSNASREGARYATKYHTDSAGNHTLASALSPSISDYVIKTSAENSGNGGVGLASLLPSDSSPSVSNADLISTTLSPGYTSGNPGDDITVTVTATKNWFVIDKFIPGMSDHINLMARTVMKCE